MEPIPPQYFDSSDDPPRRTRWLRRATAHLSHLRRKFALRFGPIHQPDPIENARSFPLSTDEIALTHSDTDVGGVKSDASGFLFEPYGEALISDCYVDLENCR